MIVGSGPTPRPAFKFDTMLTKLLLRKRTTASGTVSASQRQPGSLVNRPSKPTISCPRRASGQLGTPRSGVGWAAIHRPKNVRHALGDDAGAFGTRAPAQRYVGV